MRRPKTDRVPRTRAGGEWTEASFWSFIRSALRQSSRRWPPIARQALHAVRRPYRGPNARQKWEHLCADCGHWYAAKEIHVDHIEPCGTLKSFTDLAAFAERLFCEAEKLRVLCEECHEVRTKQAKGT